MKTGVFFIMVAAAFVCAGCKNVQEDGDDSITTELAGRWYDDSAPYNFAFSITTAGEGYIAHKKLQCTVTVSGKTVYFKDSHGYQTGSFHIFH